VDRAEAWARVAAIRDEELHQSSEALAATSAALALQPDHRDALERRMSLLRRAGRWGELAETLGRCILVEESLAKRALLYAVLGELYDEQLADPVQGAACFRLALELDPSSASALNGLERLLLRRGAAGELVDLLEKRAERATPAEQRAL